MVLKKMITSVSSLDPYICYNFVKSEDYVLFLHDLLNKYGFDTNSKVKRRSTNLIDSTDVYNSYFCGELVIREFFGKNEVLTYFYGFDKAELYDYIISKASFVKNDESDFKRGKDEL